MIRLLCVTLVCLIAGLACSRNEAAPRSVRLSVESGRVIENPSRQQIADALPNEEFSIIGSDEQSYLQCAKAGADEPGDWVLEYQDGSLEKHYAASPPPTLEQIIAAFQKAANGDSSWKSEFRWKKIQLKPAQDAGR